MRPDLNIGDFVEYSGEDSCYRGNIVSIFQKKGGKYRVVVENDEGLLLIKGTKCKVVDTVQGLWVELKNLIEEWYKGKDVFLDIPSYLSFITLVEDATKGLDMEIERDGFIIRLKKISKGDKEVTLEEFYKNPYFKFEDSPFGYNNALNLGELVYKGNYRIWGTENGYYLIPLTLHYHMKGESNFYIISENYSSALEVNGEEKPLADIKIGDKVTWPDGRTFVLEDTNYV